MALKNGSESLKTEKRSLAKKVLKNPSFRLEKWKKRVWIKNVKNKNA